MKSNLIAYYNQRAKEYETIYQKPERQNDLEKAALILQQTFSNKNIIEIACGTGYWTEKIATTAASIFATDINDTVIEMAKNKHYPNNNITFAIADFHSYEPALQYAGLFGGIIWSHVPLQDLHKFIAKANTWVTPGGIVAFMDNKFVQGSNLPITKTDQQGNTFQTRVLKNGSTHEVLKNFPAKKLMLEKLKGNAEDVQFIELEYYWIIIYKTPPY